MPELPEVETIRRDLEKRIVGCCFDRVTLLWPEIVRKPSPQELCHRLPGQKIQKTGRRGKYLLLRLSGETLILHLKMSGCLLLKPASAEADNYLRASFGLDNGMELRFCDRRKLGAAWLVKNEEEIIGKLGWEPFDAGFTAEVLSKLLARRQAPIKALLCDQSLIAGIGNMYADEALFEAKIHPLTPAKAISPQALERLYLAIRQVLERAIGEKGASVDTYQRPGGELGTAHLQFKVAHRGGKLCPACGSPIQRLPIRGRGSYFCPRCQKKP